ncbi:MarR family EPS-associated transcriptional regulator [Hippea jasoniae]|uniref:MarR family EPS-associated transcriptional regulator n=1 Tax=Hippea jasoniae TaxID=944479 RepID=UPI000556192F|nr:MarR family EPS-associated transcriptional regulator [Hippea jasoniae]
MEQNEIVVKLLSAIKKNPEQSQRSLSKAIGVSVGKVNYVVKELAKKGIIKTERFLNSNNKWQYRYILTPEGIKEKARITREFVKRKMAEYESLLNDD